MKHPDQQLDGTFLCRFDGTSHTDLSGLHAHLKRFRVSREKYYTLYHPRKDRLTGECLPWKDADQYLTQEFASKITMRKWLAKYPEEGFAWSKAWLARRKAEKGIEYAPSQTELRLLQCPSMPYYEEVGKAEGGYYGITHALGYKDRYTLEPLTFFPLFADTVIIQDSREQQEIVLPWKTRVEALSVGDYALAAPYDKGIRIERKSLGDFCGTMSERKVARKGGRKGKGATEDSSLQRFERELERAREQNLYVVMMVEANITDAQRFDYLPQTQWIRARPSHIFHSLRTLLHKYPLHFQCCFVDGRAQMARTMMRVFELAHHVRTCDLQFALEQGVL